MTTKDSTMTNELEQLKKLALAAAQVVWEVLPASQPVHDYSHCLHGKGYGAIGYWKGHKDWHKDCNWVLTQADAEYIAAACNVVPHLIAQLEQHNTKPSAVDGAIEVPDWLAQKWDDGFFTAPSVIVTRQQFIAQQAIAWDRQNRAAQPVQGVAESVVDEESFEKLVNAVAQAAFADGKKSQAEAVVASPEFHTSKQAPRTFFKQSRQSPRAEGVKLAQPNCDYCSGPEEDRAC
jgi:hypothetical protein